MKRMISRIYAPQGVYLRLPSPSGQGLLLYPLLDCAKYVTAITV